MCKKLQDFQKLTLYLQYRANKPEVHLINEHHETET